MNIDQDFGLRNADWINTVAWDLPRTVEPFLVAIGGPDKLAHFLTLPAAEAMPPELRLALDIRELEKSLKYSEDQARDDHGRWTSGGGGGGEALTTGPSPSPVTPENFREHWKPEMTPAEGHAWAEAAGTKYPATVVHMTSVDAVAGIVGTGFHTDAIQANHENGAYFATDPDTAEFYEYKGDEVVSAVVVLQNPLVLDWTDPENLSEPAQEGEFRRAALEAAGYDPESIAAAMPDMEIYAFEGESPQFMLDNAAGPEVGYERWEVESMIWGNVDNPKDSTELLRMKGYDGVILTPLNEAERDPSTGGSQLIVFDKEQAVVIGTDQLPAIDFSRPFVEIAPNELERVQEPGVDESRTAVIERAFQKREYVRDERGRFAETEGDGLPDTVVGLTEEGTRQAVTLFEDTADQYASFATEQDAVAAKTENIKVNGAYLYERSKTDPDLHTQLTAMGNRVEDQLDQEYKDRYLHLEPGMNWAEIGAAYAANAFQMTWMQSATDTSTVSLALHQAVADKFSIDTSDMSLFSNVDGNLGDSFLNQQAIDAFDLAGEVSATDAQGDIVDALAASPMTKAYVDGVYERTQQELKDAGITEVSCFRGMGNVGIGPIHNDTILLNPVSSFSTSDEIGHQFAESSMGYGAAVLEATIPAERIFSTANTGPGCLRETELLVIGGPIDARILPVMRY